MPTFVGQGKSVARNEKEMLRGFVLTVLELGNTPFFEAAIEPLRRSNNVNELRSFAADLVEMYQDMVGQDLAELDKLLLERGFPSMSEMRDRNVRRLREILSTGRIKSNDDWRFVESYLSDVDSHVLTNKDRETANKILAEYDAT